MESIDVEKRFRLENHPNKTLTKDKIEMNQNQDDRIQVREKISIKKKLNDLDGSNESTATSNRRGRGCRGRNGIRGRQITKQNSILNSHPRNSSKNHSSTSISSSSLNNLNSSIFKRSMKVPDYKLMFVIFKNNNY